MKQTELEQRHKFWCFLFLPVQIFFLYTTGRAECARAQEMTMMMKLRNYLSFTREKNINAILSLNGRK